MGKIKLRKDGQKELVEVFVVGGIARIMNINKNITVFL